MGKYILLAATALSLSACVTTRENEASVPETQLREYLADKPKELHKHFAVNLMQGQRNQALNSMRLGLATLEMGNDQLATELFESALGVIETVYADNEAAKAARSVFTKETVKDFKGEPYERAMAYYYRGLIHLRRGEYEDARVAFRRGEFQDSLSEEDQNRSDFGLMNYLMGWAAQCAGRSDVAADDLKVYQSLQRNVAPPSGDDNVLILVETGNSPIKISDVDPSSNRPWFLKFARGGQADQPWVVLPEKVMPRSDQKNARNRKGTAAPAAQIQYREEPLHVLEDIYYQASTRGGRQFDYVLKGKAQFKDTANTAGTVMLATGTTAMTYGMASGNDNAAVAGAIVALMGVMAKAAADAAEPDADTRYWDNLPDRIHARSAKLPDDVTSLRVIVKSEANNTVLKEMDVPIVRQGQCGVAWARATTAMPQTVRAPNSVPPELMSAPVNLPSLEPEQVQPDEDAKPKAPLMSMAPGAVTVEIHLVRS